LEGGDLHVPIENKWFQLAANPRDRSCSNLFSCHPALLADSHHVGPYFCGMSPRCSRHRIAEKILISKSGCNLNFSI
jgi:hypothetical protein